MIFCSSYFFAYVLIDETQFKVSLAVGTVVKCFLGETLGRLRDFETSKMAEYALLFSLWEEVSGIKLEEARFVNIFIIGALVLLVLLYKGI